MSVRDLFFVIFFFSFAGFAVAADYYVALGGNDTQVGSLDMDGRTRAQQKKIYIDAAESTYTDHKGGILMMMPSILAVKANNSNACYRHITDEPALVRYKLLEDISTWFYFLGFEPTATTIQQVVESTYDMVVMEPIFTDIENVSYPTKSVVTRLHDAAHSKLVLAYVDIGQAEDWRTYWQDDWGIGNPSWIVADDPDGWEGNYPVKYWHPDWKNIWLGTSGYLQKIIDAGFDGIYLDWVEAYSDENILTAAIAEGRNAKNEMISWVGELASFGRALSPEFIVIGQNAAELVARDDYLVIIDGIAQEQTWFDGSADNTPPGDCPLAATDSDIETSSYEQNLQDIDRERGQTDDGCYTMYVDYPESTLHVSSEEYLQYLTFALDECEVVFTVDYTLLQQNVDEVYTESRKRGFVPFASERNLSVFIDPVPQ